MGKPKVTVVVEDENGRHEWTPTGCLVTVISRGGDGEVGELSTALLGVVSDHELLMMLRYTLDKMQETLEDPDLAEVSLIEHMIAMGEAMAAQEKQMPLAFGSSQAH